MPPRRIGPVRTDVTLRVDGEEVLAVRGEPIAVALAASGRLVLGRSVKYHRPRGAFCYAGRCDGCLMRVDGAPSQMTCRTPCVDGLEIETQNVLGTADVDLLSATDWFFPGGMNHHEMFTWSKAANRAMQSVARRIAGVGRLPDSSREARAPLDHSVDVLVVGGGPTGLVAATHAARAGLRVLLVDEEDAPGGHLGWTPGAVRTHEGGLAKTSAHAAALSLADDARSARVSMLARTSVVGVYDASEHGVLAIADGRDTLVRVRARRVIFAQGRHEGAWAFEGNDLPGVIGSDAACRLLAQGVLPGARILLAGSTSDASPGTARLRALASALEEAGAEVLGPFELSRIARARGRNGVSSCDVRTVDAIERLECDAVVIAPRTSAVYELAEQAGVEVVWDGGGFEIVAGHADGSTRVACARVIGRASGVTSLPAGMAQAIAAARAIALELATASPREGAPRG